MKKAWGSQPQDLVSAISSLLLHRAMVFELPIISADSLIGKMSHCVPLPVLKMQLLCRQAYVAVPNIDRWRYSLYVTNSAAMLIRL